MTRIRPCIDLHEGQVKQIVGSSLRTDTSSGVVSGVGVSDRGTSTSSTTTAQVNFASDRPPSYFSELYRHDGLTRGHVILLGSTEANVKAAKDALGAWRGGWQVGGGITAGNCQMWLEAGAGKIIVTSYLFEGAVLQYGRLQELVRLIGKDRLVIDLSCRRKSADDPNYYVVTNKWQTYTDTALTKETLDKLGAYCDEFLVHAVDVEGKQAGIQTDLVEFLGEHSPIPVTYAGGVRNLEDLDLVERLGRGRVDVTVGSALDIFGGTLAYKDVVDWHKARNDSAS